MKLTEEQRQSVAEVLAQAYDTHELAPQPSQTYPEFTLEDAYDVQSRAAQLRMSKGPRIVGRKVGLTSRALQQAAGVSEPIMGAIFADAIYTEGAKFALSALHQPRVETELAFVMGEDIGGPGLQAHDVMRAAECVSPALEVVVSRTQTPRTTVDAVADNASFGGIVLGGRVVKPFDVDLSRVGVVLSVNGGIEDTGLSAAVMGHPAASVAWLLEKLADAGEGLKKGDIILSGSFTRPFAISTSSVVQADYGPLGAIGVAFE